MWFSRYGYKVAPAQCVRFSTSKCHSQYPSQMESKAGSIIVLSGGTSSRCGADKSQVILGHQQ
jgi:hypothetical protein